MIRATGSQIIVHLLKRQGVGVVAGIPGGANLPLYDALACDGAIRHVLARHEQGAAFIAQGIARTTGRAGVCFATSGPGATNTLTALADAMLDSVPLLCITGQVPRALIGTDAFQEVDIYGMSLPATKHNFLVRSAAELLDVVPEAFRIAESGRPGPVLIDVPKDVQTEETAFGAWPAAALPDVPPSAEARALRAAADLLNRSERPLLLLGGGLVQSGAGPAAIRLAQKAGMPMASTLMALGAVPCDHPLALGLLGMHGAPGTNRALEECDVLLAAGARFDDRATGRAADFCPNARIIHIDIDPSEVNKVRRADVGIVADVRGALEGLLPHVRADRREAWRRRVRHLQERYPLRMPGAADPRRPYGLVREVARQAGADAFVATDVGQHQMWTAQAYPFRRARRWLTSGGLGTMGFGLPAALGAALANPGETVVCFTGDGSLLMNIQELATAAEERLPVKLVLFNNRSLGLVRQQQTLFYGGRHAASEFRVGVDFCAVARAFGAAAVDLDSAAEPSAAISQALQVPGPCLLHASIDAGEMVLPMVPPGKPNREMIGAQAHAPIHA